MYGKACNKNANAVIPLGARKHTHTHAFIEELQTNWAAVFLDSSGQFQFRINVHLCVPVSKPVKLCYVITWVIIVYLHGWLDIMIWPNVILIVLRTLMIVCTHFLLYLMSVMFACLPACLPDILVAVPAVFPSYILIPPLLYPSTSWRLGQTVHYLPFLSWTFDKVNH